MEDFMNDFIIDETTNALVKYDFPFTNAHLGYLLVPHCYYGKHIDSIAPYCFGQVQIETLVIGEGIKELQFRAFEGSHCYNVELPKGIKMNEYCFFNSRLQEITLPSDLTTIKASTFSRCKKLRSIKDYAAIETIGYQAFAFCHQLKELHFESLTSVDDAAFFGCTGLRALTLGNNIEHLGRDIFYGCDDLQDVTLTGSFDKLEADTFVEARGIKRLTLSTSADSLYIPPHCFDGTCLEEITFLGEYKPIIKERSCLPDNVLIRTPLCSPAMELGYYYPLKAI